MAVISMASVARYLVRIRVPEQDARAILQQVRTYITQHPAQEWGGQMIGIDDAVTLLGDHGKRYKRWIFSDRCDERYLAVDDWQTGGCVVLATTLLEFLHSEGVRENADGATALCTAQTRCVQGVIIARHWGEFVPGQLLPAWLSFNGIPPDTIAAVRATLHDPATAEAAK